MTDEEKQNARQALTSAQLAAVEYALLGFVEQLLGRAPSDDEILRDGLHMTFAMSPLATFEKKGVVFNRYYVWQKRHLLALGFMDKTSPATLSIARVPDDQWPSAVTMYVRNHYADPEAEERL